MDKINNLLLTDKVIQYSSEWFKDITNSCWSVHIQISLNKLVDLPDDECIEYFNNLSMEKAKSNLLSQYKGESIRSLVPFVYKS